VSEGYPLPTTMKAGKVNHEEDEYDDDEFNSNKKQATSSAPNNTNKGTLKSMFLYFSYVIVRSNYKDVSYC